MRYNSITTCDIVNGQGLGVVLWCQGCDLKCNGCHNKETWDFNQGLVFDESAKIKILQELKRPYITRLTLSGGHPLAPQNLEGCLELCKYIKSNMPEIQIWVYTGYYFEDIKHYEILNYIDVLIDGPFDLSQRDITLPFRGSRNQRIFKKNKNKWRQVKYE